MTRILITILTIFFWSCGQNPETTKKSLETVEHVLQTPDTLEKKNLNWVDQYVNWYLAQEAENLMTNDSLTLSFIKDYQIRQGRKTVQVRVGYDLQHRFEVRKWLYIDFETHSLAEYDLENAFVLV
jgi:beta-glucanase (GH16 family)